MAKSGSGFRMVNWSIWRPSARLMQRLRFPGKMTLVILPAALAMLTLLALYVAAAKEDWVFVDRERQGVAYGRAVLSAMEASDRWRYEARLAAFGEASTQVESSRQAYIVGSDLFIFKQRPVRQHPASAGCQGHGGLISTTLQS